MALPGGPGKPRRLGCGRLGAGGSAWLGSRCQASRATHYLTGHSSRTCFASRLNSGVRCGMKPLRKLSAAVIVLVTSAALAGVPHSSAAHADIYYRSFDSTSIVALDASALISASEHHLVLNTPSQLQVLFRALPASCKPVPATNVVDLRLLIRWSGSHSWSWQASQFAYYDGRTGQSCKFSRAQQSKLLAALGLGR